MRDGPPEVTWSDAEIVACARRISERLQIPVVKVRLMCAVDRGHADTAEVSFFGPITVRRYCSADEFPNMMTETPKQD